MARFGVYQVDEYKKKKTRAVLRRQSKDKRYIFGACGRHTSHYMDGLRVASWKIYRKSVKPLVLKAVSDIMALLYPSKETSLTYEVQSLHETVRSHEERIRKLEEARPKVQLTHQKSVETHTLSAYHHKNAREEDRSNCRKDSGHGQKMTSNTIPTHPEKSAATASPKDESGTKRPFDALELQRSAKKLRRPTGHERTQVGSKADKANPRRTTAIDPTVLLGAKAKLKSQYQDIQTNKKVDAKQNTPSRAIGITANALQGAKAKLREATAVERTTGNDERSSSNTLHRTRTDISANTLNAAKARLRSGGKSATIHDNVQSAIHEQKGHVESPSNLITSQALFFAKGQLKKVNEETKKDPSEESAQNNQGNGLLQQVLKSSMLKRFQESGVSDTTGGSSLAFTKNSHKENVEQPLSDPSYKSSRKAAFNNRTNSPSRPLQLNDASLNGIKSGLRSTPQKRSPGGTPVKNNPKVNSPLNPGQNVSDTRGGRGSCHGDFLRDALAKRFAVIHGEKDSPASSTDSEGSTTPLRQHLL
eukprot:gb/GECG01016706.1/.p1 GENE.gb/GECG01016706.1/~~gb/GECG01016706.1/.p1  ORF type:complete len:533 (+),score=72.69 gb/GECG01016706.1/:1-1599(+)